MLPSQQQRFVYWNLVAIASVIGRSLSESIYPEAGFDAFQADRLKTARCTLDESAYHKLAEAVGVSFTDLSSPCNQINEKELTKEYWSKVFEQRNPEHEETTMGVQTSHNTETATAGVPYETVFASKEAVPIRTAISDLMKETAKKAPLRVKGQKLSEAESSDLVSGEFIPPVTSLSSWIERVKRDAEHLTDRVNHPKSHADIGAIESFAARFQKTEAADSDDTREQTEAGPETELADDVVVNDAVLRAVVTLARRIGDKAVLHSGTMVVGAEDLPDIEDGIFELTRADLQSYIQAVDALDEKDWSQSGSYQEIVAYIGTPTTDVSETSSASATDLDTDDEQSEVSETVEKMEDDSTTSVGEAEETPEPDQQTVQNGRAWLVNASDHPVLQRGNPEAKKVFGQILGVFADVVGISRANIDDHVNKANFTGNLCTAGSGSVTAEMVIKAADLLGVFPADLLQDAIPTASEAEASRAAYAAHVDGTSDGSESEEPESGTEAAASAAEVESGAATAVVAETTADEHQGVSEDHPVYSPGTNETKETLAALLRRFADYADVTFKDLAKEFGLGGLPSGSHSYTPSLLDRISNETNLSIEWLLQHDETVDDDEIGAEIRRNYQPPAQTESGAGESTEADSSPEQSDAVDAADAGEETSSVSDPESVAASDDGVAGEAEQSEMNEEASDAVQTSSTEVMPNGSTEDDSDGWSNHQPEELPEPAAEVSTVVNGFDQTTMQTQVEGLFPQSKLREMLIDQLAERLDPEGVILLAMLTGEDQLDPALIVPGWEDMEDCVSAFAKLYSVNPDLVALIAQQTMSTADATQ